MEEASGWEFALGDVTVIRQSERLTTLDDHLRRDVKGKNPLSQPDVDDAGIEWVDGRKYWKLLTQQVLVARPKGREWYPVILLPMETFLN